MLPAGGTLTWTRLQGFAGLFAVGAVPGFQGRLADPARDYKPELTGLRGVAILIVVAGHLLERTERFHSGGGAPSGLERTVFALLATPFSGCCMFFCISGYTLLKAMQPAHRRADPAAASLYRARRLVRLSPPYFLVLVATYVFLQATHYVPPGTRQFQVEPHSLTVSLLASLGFCHDLIFGTFPRLFPPGWFIETQVQFYLVAPALWVAYLRLPTERLRRGAGLLGLVATSAVATLADRYGPKNIAYSLIVFLPYFWIGALLANDDHALQSSRFGRILRRHQAIGWCGLAAFVLVGEQSADTSVQMAVRLACLAVIFTAARAPGGSLQRAMVSRWLARIGIASYSIFLLHLQILQVATPIITTVAGKASILPLTAICGLCDLSVVGVAAAVFYWVVERPLIAALERRVYVRSNANPGSMAT